MDLPALHFTGLIPHSIVKIISRYLTALSGGWHAGKKKEVLLKAHSLLMLTAAPTRTSSKPV